MSLTAILAKAMPQPGLASQRPLAEEFPIKQIHRRKERELGSGGACL